MFAQHQSWLVAFKPAVPLFDKHLMHGRRELVLALRGDVEKNDFLKVERYGSHGLVGWYYVHLIKPIQRVKIGVGALGARPSDFVKEWASGFHTHRVSRVKLTPTMLYKPTLAPRMVLSHLISMSTTFGRC